MHLSNEEEKLVTRLKKHQQSFIRWRLGTVTSALTCTGAGFYIILVLLRFLSKGELTLEIVLIVSLAMPAAFLLFFGGLLLTVHVFSCWNGQPQTRLLLRLIEDSQGLNS